MTSRQHSFYYAPARPLFDEYVRRLCEQLEQHGNVECRHPEIVEGLADFLHYVAELTAKYLNAGHCDLLDNTPREE